MKTLSLNAAPAPNLASILFGGTLLNDGFRWVIQPAKPRLWVSTPEAAKMLQISWRTLHDLREDEEAMKFLKYKTKTSRPGSPLLWCVESLQAYDAHRLAQAGRN